MGWQQRGIHDDASLLDHLYSQLLRAEEAGAAESPPGSQAASEQARGQTAHVLKGLEGCLKGCLKGLRVHAPVDTTL